MSVMDLQGISTSLQANPSPETLFPLTSLSSSDPELVSSSPLALTALTSALSHEGLQSQAASSLNILASAFPESVSSISTDALATAASRGCKPAAQALLSLVHPRTAPRIWLALKRILPHTTQGIQPLSSLCWSLARIPEFKDTMALDVQYLLPLLEASPDEISGTIQSLTLSDPAASHLSSVPGLAKALGEGAEAGCRNALAALAGIASGGMTPEITAAVGHTSLSHIPSVSKSDGIDHVIGALYHVLCDKMARRDLAPYFTPGVIGGLLDISCEGSRNSKWSSLCILKASYDELLSTLLMSCPKFIGGVGKMMEGGTEVQRSAINSIATLAKPGSADEFSALLPKISEASTSDRVASDRCMVSILSTATCLVNPPPTLPVGWALEVLASGSKTDYHTLVCFKALLTVSKHSRSEVAASQEVQTMITAATSPDKQPSGAKFYAFALHHFLHSSHHPETSDYSYLDLATSYYNLISRDKSEPATVRDNLEFLGYTLAPSIPAYIFTSTTDASTWDAETDRVAIKALTVLVKVSSNSSVASTLRSTALIDSLSTVASSDTYHALKATLALTFLGARIASALVSGSTLTRIVDLLSNTLHERGDEEYSFGVFMLKTPVKAVEILAREDGSKRLLVEFRAAEVPRLLTEVVRRFVEGEAGTIAGGGGDDIPTACTAVKALLELSFLYDSDGGGNIVEEFKAVDTGLLEILIKFIENEKVSEDAKSAAAGIKRKLNQALRKEAEIEKQDSAVTTTPRGSVRKNKKHIMLSYCWNKRAKPRFVAQFGTMLTEMGYDVWRDEIGSSLVPPMGNSTEETMALAIEKACVVVIFISKEYKASANCRLEATYAQQRKKKGKVKILFVMMQEEYTTVSKDEEVDGWLGIMIGDQLWYAMWKEEMVGGAVGEVATILGAEARLEYVGGGGAAAAKELNEKGKYKARKPIPKENGEPGVAGGGTGEDKASEILSPTSALAVSTSGSKAVGDLSLEEVKALFQSVNLGKYTLLVDKHEIDGKVLECIETVDDLEDLGAEGLSFSKLHAKKLVRFCDQWRSSGVIVG